MLDEWVDLKRLIVMLVYYWWLFIDHYLASDSNHVYLMKVTNRSDVEAGKYPQLSFQ